MQFVLRPWQLYFLILAGWVNRQQQDVINHLRIENQIVKEKLGKKRILLNDDQRRRLAVSGKVLGRKLLEEVGTLFTPDTILRWHRESRVSADCGFNHADRSVRNSCRTSLFRRSHSVAVVVERRHRQQTARPTAHGITKISLRAAPSPDAQ